MGKKKKRFSHFESLVNKSVVSISVNRIVLLPGINKMLGVGRGVAESVEKKGIYFVIEQNYSFIDYLSFLNQQRQKTNGIGLNF